MTPLRRPGATAALLALAVGLVGCSAAGRENTSAASTAATTGAAPSLASSSLVDDVDPVAATWATTWRACFAAGGDALERWEVQAVTAEGVVPRTEELPGGCVELGIAQGVGSPDGDPVRDAALADAASLAYRARGVRTDGTVTPWSDPVPVGTVTAGG